jgi:hypothetical protein
MFHFTLLKTSIRLSQEGGTRKTPLITHFPFLNPTIITIVPLMRKNGRKLYTLLAATCKPEPVPSPRLTFSGRATAFVLLKKNIN